MKPKSSSLKLSVVIERLEKTFGKKDAAITTCLESHCRPPV
jgi:hypothetical protein